MAEVLWEGLDTFIARMTDMGGKVAEKAGEIMGEIGTEAKDLMDAGTPVRTGELKSHNKLETEGTGFTLINDSDHAIFLELGTRYQPAQPFLAPATENATQQMAQKLLKALEE
jgi:HK97 gp10 family phage protein